jgi:hypothetical protein
MNYLPTFNHKWGLGSENSGLLAAFREIAMLVHQNG